MEVVLNELSLDGQFDSLELFLTTLRSTIKLQKILEIANAPLLRHHELYQRQVTSQLSLFQVLTDNSMRTSSEVRSFKILLQKLMYEEPFWTSSPKHNSFDKYLFLGSEMQGYSIAEACERGKIILSFAHEHFRDEQIEVIKNGDSITLLNIISPDTLINLIWESNLIIDPKVYCHHKYEGSSKLSFSLLEREYGFQMLDQDEIRAFLSTFEAFCKMTWVDIGKSDGLQYKLYSPSSQDENWFRNSQYRDKVICKFRTSRKYRCFGYRENDVFYILRFERDHEISNRG
ncbi:MAG6450 family protein [Paenibacillus sp. MMS18-CY102]|uniref:MAG6450 family protein n=1 Tax=Paenibacillus sp. MMS18-CY102 TaxID=2682849 RepID=UPI00136591EF|nr:hypothetical protein [Paenibacillus sp. MMS18-CY102]MWC30773.1 hypothetical protein [Paenibacillus sp. MMS18-CY102]